MPYEALNEHLDNQKQYDYDPRFRSMNRMRECTWNYGDYFRCVRVLGDRGDDTKPCNWFKKQYQFQCMDADQNEWNDQRESGVFWGRMY
eukprot:TRINITY_DN3684_c0_g1_i1.p2 TRINITY_DN3684_c0_g1~~TRINITY_DN3684_c0_g1_i1.p2  ORF type:complete len:89 (+),score=1.40 TRINITY_DN3684_c0_g1_i1:70-336(+)